MVLRQLTSGAEDRDGLSQWLDGPRPDPASPRPAATVLLLRPMSEPTAAGSTGIEVFLMRRRSTMAFAPLMYVFPGGGVDRRDSDRDLPWVGPSPQEWAQALGVPTELAQPLVCAAVRELFEESGVLLAGGVSGGSEGAEGARVGGVVADLSDASWESDRLALLDRSLPLVELLGRRGLALRSDLLRPWAHWLTPEIEPRRYDTWFFVAVLPAGQIARDVGGEADRSGWFELDHLLRSHQAGRIAMMPPTVVTVEEVVTAVRAHRSLGGPVGPGGRGHDALTAVLSTPKTLRRVMPWVVRDDAGQPVLVVDVDGRGGGRPEGAS